MLDSLLETSRNPTTTTNWGEVLPAEDQNDKIMLSWIDLNSLVDMSSCFLTVLVSKGIEIYKVPQVAGNHCLHDQAHIARFTSWNWKEWAFPTITAKCVKVFCTKYQIVKIMLSWIKKIGYVLVVIILPSHSFVKKNSNLEIIPSKWKPVFKLSSTNLLKLLRYVILQPNSALI